MSKDRQYWKKFWAAKDNPLHSAADDDYYDRLAAELRLLLPQGFSSFLDIGCGNGTFYKRLGLDTIRYTGIDLSEAMVAKFKATHPSAQVMVCDVSEFYPGQSFDVIFSHGVLQNIPFAELPSLLRKNSEWLAPGGQIIHAGILWDRGRRLVESGVLTDHPLPRHKRWGNMFLTRSHLKRGMGHWYSMKRTRQAAEGLGFSVSFFGSMYYPYRFHMILKRK